MSTLHLCGVGNGEGIRLALQVQRAIGCWDRIVLLDDDAAKHGTERLGLPVEGGFERLAHADPAVDEVVNLVTRTAAGRARARERIARFGIPFVSLVHPQVDLLGAWLDPEVTIYERAVIGADACVGQGSVVLVGAVVGHGSRVGRGCVVAPNAVINARVVLEDGVYVGSNASLLPDLHIGAGATIAANTLVLSDVPAGATALGVPATLMQPGTVPMGPPAAQILDAPAVTVPGPDCAALQARIAGAMGALLGRAEVPHGINFFDLGGTSLKAMQLCQTLRDEHGLAVQPLDLFQCPSVQALAARLAGVRVGGSALGAAHQRAAMRRRR